MDKNRLQESSSMHMRRSIDAFFSGEVDMAVLHAGIAVEHLLKAFLASKHPSLLVDGRDFRSLLHAIGESTLAESDVYHIKSIGASECYKRVSQFISLPLTDRQAEPIFNARNGVAHLGLHQSDKAHEILTKAMQVNRAILTGLGGDARDYWNGYAVNDGHRWNGPDCLESARKRWLDSLKEQHEENRIGHERSASVAARIAYARKVFEIYGSASCFVRFKRYPEQQPLEFQAWRESRAPLDDCTRSNDLRELYSRYCKDWFRVYREEGDRVRSEVLEFLKSLTGFNRQFPHLNLGRFEVPTRFDAFEYLTQQRWVKCPVCGFTMALLREQGHCFIGPLDWPEAYEEDYMEIWKIIQPELLDCAVCLLQLDSNAELEIVGLDLAWNENGPIDRK